MVSGGRSLEGISRTIRLVNKYYQKVNVVI